MSRLILTPAASSNEEAAFNLIGKRGLDKNTVEDELGGELDERVHLWPLPADAGIEPSQVGHGDTVLFSSYGNEYKWAARVNRVVVSAELRERIHSLLVSNDIEFNDKDRFGSTILVLETPIRVDVSTFELHDYIGRETKSISRTFIPPDVAVQSLVEDYGTLDNYIRQHRKAPTVWVESTKIEGRDYKQPDGEYPLGTSVFSRSESSDGRDVYWSLREAEVGDIVLHALVDKRQITGASIVTSTLDEDFEGPPDGSWPDEARGNGYFRALSDYQSLSEPLHVYDDLLDNKDHKTKLREINESYDGLFYNKNLEFAEGKYLTEAPLELLYLIIAQAPEFLDIFESFYWDVPQPEGTAKYNSVSEAVTDTLTRLAFAENGIEWFHDAFTASVIEAISESLSSVEPNCELTQAEATHCKLIERSYHDIEEGLRVLAKEIKNGRTNQISEIQTLYFVMFRELQRRIGIPRNMNQVKIRTIIDENYTIEHPGPEPDEFDPTEPLEPAPMPHQGEEIRRQLARNGQVVFYGPPGTSKTYTAQRFARWWLNEHPTDEPTVSQLETVTFHPSFTYEDFIEGLSATTTDEGQVTYDEEPGSFLKIANRARSDYYAADEDEEPPRYVLIIDEINRGNLAQIFGETITALEYDKRLDQDNASTISLAHSGDSFDIPPNLYLIGTMNTADRSIALVDAALRRRFRFLSFPPEFELLFESLGFSDWGDVEASASQTDRETELKARSLLALKQLNERIRDAPNLGRGKQIGHSFFFGIESEADLVDVWRYEILPLLEEYYFGQFERIQDKLFAGGGDELFDWEREQIKQFDAETLHTELGDLIGVPDSDGGTTEQ